MRTIALVVVATIFASSGEAFAQQLTCAPIQHVAASEPCVFERKGDEEVIILRVLGPDGKALKDAKVHLKAMLGTVNNTVTSDANGIVLFTWKAKPEMGTAVDSITAYVDDGNRNSQLAIKLRPGGAKNLISLAALNDKQAWYAGRQLKQPVWVELQQVAIADCRGQTVLFKTTTDGQVFPDSAKAELDGNQCLASTRWKLAPTGGVQGLRAWVAGSSAQPILIEAKARKEPWLAAGLAVSSDNEYTTITDSVPVRVPGGTSFAATLGINTPMFTRYTPLRLSASADIKRPTTDWYLGFSIPQLYDGLWHEDMGVDLQLLGHLSKRVVPKDDACTTSCATDSRTRFVGVALAVQLNASIFLAAVSGLFASK